MKNKLICLVILLVPMLIMAQSQDTTKTNFKNNKLANNLYNESLSLFEEQNYTEAITMINKAIALNPEFAKAYYNRACYQLQLGDLDEAIVDFTTSIKLNASSITYTGRGYVYLLKKDYE